MLKRIIIFGAFKTGKKAFQMMKSQYDIIAFSDNCSDYHGKKLFDIPVIPPEKILTLQVELVVIASMNYYMEISRQLIAMGINHIKLFWTKTGTQNYVLLDVDGEEPFTNYTCRKIEIKQYNNKGENLEVSNKQRKKKVLVIAYYFPPAGSSPIQRTLKFVKYMQEYGYEPIVLTTEPDSYLNYFPIDQSLLADVPEGIKIIRIKDELSWSSAISKKKSQEIIDFLFEVSNSKKWIDSYIKIQRKQLSSFLPDRLILWASECVRNIEHYISMRDIDLLYSTVPEWSPHLIAYFLKKKYAIKWVADYRDPWVSNKDYVKLYYPWMSENEVDLEQEIEKKITQEMDSIIVAGGKWAVDFVKNYDIEPDRIKEITNGYDEEDFADLIIKTEKNVKFTLCYNGNVAYNRNPIPLIKVLNTLIEKGILNSNDIQWIFNGMISDYYLEKIKNEDIYQLTVYNGFLQHKESLQIAVNSDIMVMYGEPGIKGILNYPGKFYEYLRIGKPILCFSAEESYQAEVLRETGLGVNLDLYDASSAEAFLSKYVTAWKNNKKIINKTREIIQKYERKNLTKMLVEEFKLHISKE